MMKSNMTAHARFDRSHRLATLLSYIDLGEIILSVDNKSNPGTQMCLTTTGVIVIRSSDTKKIITAYLCSMKLCYALFANLRSRNHLETDGEVVPKNVYRVVQYNEKHYKFLYEI